jgi:membrane dipeptidase
MWKPLLVDGHQDLAYNMLAFGRDYTRSAAQTRLIEKNTPIPGYTGDTLLGWPEFQQGRLGVIFATLFAAPIRRRLGEWDKIVYRDTAEAYQLYQAQLDLYHRLVEDHPEKFHLLLTKSDLAKHLSRWNLIAGEEETPQLPVGLVILMENAEAVRQPAELPEWWDAGVRLIGPAWAGTRFCGGTREPGPLTPEGFALLEAMADIGFVLDISHMDERAALQALDSFPGQIIASHSNALALLKDAETNRHLTDRVIEGLLERDGVIGLVPANGFLLPDWKAAGGRRAVSLEHLAAQIDYLCQMAGDALHAAIGSDFDGGFGLQSVPHEIETIADLQKLVRLLQVRGYTNADIQAIFADNWIRILMENLP